MKKKEDKLSKILEKYIVCFFSKIKVDKTKEIKYLLGVIPIDEYGKDNSRTKHYDGNTIKECLDKVEV